MSFVIGKGRQASQAYPVRSNGDAVAALSNRYLCPAIIPDPFTSLASYFVAAANVTRRASGLFVVQAQVLSQAAGVDTQAWAALLFPGAVASGGVASGDWLVSTGGVVAVAPTPVPTIIGVDGYELASAIGITLTGINAVAAPAGDSVIAIVGNTVAPSLLTMGALTASIFELP